MKPLPRTKRLYQQVADQLSDLIASGKYQLGDRLPAERDLAQRFGVSRPTVREAVIALELAGLVEVRTGSGVYVVERSPVAMKTSEMDIGPFELTEARALFEGEAAALAATLITDEQLAELDATIDEMIEENKTDVEGEIADRKFHMMIAQFTQNSAIASVVEDLWDVRHRSPLVSRMLDKVRKRGVKPRIDEHRAIADALRSRSPSKARAAMRRHLSRVIDGLLDATEVEVLEEARKRVNRQRARYGVAKKTR